MAEIHPDLKPLFEALRDSGFGAYVDDAETRIREEDETLIDIPGLFHSEGPPTDTGALAQMRLAEAAILWPFKRELEMIKDLKHDAGIFEISKVILTPDPDENTPAWEPDNLIGREREQAIRDFIDAWIAEANRLRSKWEPGVDNDDR